MSKPTNTAGTTIKKETVTRPTSLSVDKGLPKSEIKSSADEIAKASKRGEAAVKKKGGSDPLVKEKAIKKMKEKTGKDLEVKTKMEKESGKAAKKGLLSKKALTK